MWDSTVAPEQVDGGIGEVGEIGEGLFLDAALVVAEGAAQELGVVGLAVLDGLDDGDVHGGTCLVPTEASPA